MVSNAHKRKRELVKDEEEEMQVGHVALLAGAAERIVLKEKSKRSKKGRKSSPDGIEKEHTLNPSSTGQSIPNEQNLEQCMTSKDTEHGRFKSSIKMHERVSNEQQCTFNSSSKNDGQQSKSRSSQKKYNSNDEHSSRGQEVHEAEANNGDAVKVSMGLKDKKKQKTKKKKDRWGQVLNVAGNTQDTVCGVMDNAMLDNVYQHHAHEDGDESLANRDNSEVEHDSKTVCVGGMPYDMREEDILALFKNCGAVVRVVCTKFADTQRFKGLAFITFETETGASKALSLDGTNMGDRLIKVERARAGGKVLRAPPKREAGSLSVYVGNLDWGIQRVDIKRFFKGCGIDNVRLAVDRNTGKFRGYGHVDFSDEKSLKNAVKLNQKQLHGRPVKVSYAVCKGFKGKSD